MTKPTDDLEAVRVVVSTLEPFDPTERERIIRWAREKLGMPKDTAVDRTPSPAKPVETVQPSQTPTPATDIKTFINQKDPKSDNHLAAVVAYYHQFQAQADSQKDAITKDDLVAACRLADRKRPARPAQVLVNAYHAGLLDKADRAHYRLNAVGENLVAMVLPESDGQSGRTNKRRRTPGKKKKAGKKSGARKAAKQKSGKKTKRR